MLTQVLLQAGDPSKFEVSQTLLTVIGLILPTLVFLVGIYRDEDELGDSFRSLTGKNSPSFGTKLGIQGISVALLTILAYLLFVLSNYIFPTTIALSISVVLGLFTLSLLILSVILFLMIWGLADSRRSSDEVKKLREDADKTVLQQRNEELRNELRRRKQDISDLTTEFKRLDIALKRHGLYDDEDFLEEFREVAGDATDHSVFEPDGISEEDELEKETE